MKLISVLEGGSGSGRPTEKVRPDKTLWFQHKDLWLRDLQHSNGSSFDLMQVEEEEDGDMYATNKDSTVCYGMWKKDRNRGVTFAKPRPMNVVARPRATLKQMLTTPA